MAKAAVKQVSPAPAEGAAAEPKKKGKLLIIIVALIVVLAGAGAAAWFMLSNKGGEEGDEDGKTAKETKHQSAKPPVFVNLEPFTVNLQPEQGEQYLQVVAALKVDDAHAGDTVKQYMPELRHRILLLLSSKKPSELSSMQGREALAEEIRDEANTIVAPPPVKHVKTSKVADKAHGKEKEAAEGPVLSVFFTSFIIQ